MKLEPKITVIKSHKELDKKTGKTIEVVDECILEEISIVNN